MNVVIDLDTMEAIKSFKDESDPRWDRIKKCIFDNAAQATLNVVNAVPAPDDINFTARSNIDRGMAIVLGLLKGMIENVDEMLANERRNIAELQRLQAANDEAIQAMT